LRQEREETSSWEKIRLKKMRERRELPAFESAEASVRKTKVGVSGLLETLQCWFFTHFGYEGADEGVVGDSLRATPRASLKITS
jgi:hypothetical protein